MEVEGGLMNQQMQPNREANRWTPPRRVIPGALPELVARSLAMRRVAEQLQQVGTRIRLALIEGEAGTGKRHPPSSVPIPARQTNCAQSHCVPPFAGPPKACC